MTPSPPEAPPPAEILKTQPIPEGASPGAGGWVPGKYTPLIAALVVGISTSLGPVLMMPEPKWNFVVAGVLGGLATGFGTFFGMRSAGPRLP